MNPDLPADTASLGISLDYLRDGGFAREADWFAARRAEATASSLVSFVVAGPCEITVPILAGNCRVTIIEEPKAKSGSNP